MLENEAMEEVSLQNLLEMYTVVATSQGKELRFEEGLSLLHSSHILMKLSGLFETSKKVEILMYELAELFLAMAYDKQSESYPEGGGIYLDLFSCVIIMAMLQAGGVTLALDSISGPLSIPLVFLTNYAKL
jgi:hypothetical protein